MIHNYGGTTSLYGKANTLNSGPYDTRKTYQSHVGMGLAPEGIHNRYVGNLYYKGKCLFVGMSVHKINLPYARPY